MDPRKLQKEIAWAQRPAVILAILMLALTLPQQTVDMVTAGLVIPHYVTAIFFHPWKKVSRAGVLTPHLLLIASLAAFSQLQALYQFPSIVLYFGLHFVLSDLYEGRAEESLDLRFARLVYYVAGYIYFMRFQLDAVSLGPWFLAFALAGLCVTLVRSRRGSDAVFEASFILPLAMAYFYPMRFSFIILYHIMGWWFIPFARGHELFSRRYFTATAVFTAAFLCLVLGTVAMQGDIHWFWRREATRLGYLHITLSFLMSNLNPEVVRYSALRLQRGLAKVVSPS